MKKLFIILFTIGLLFATESGIEFLQTLHDFGKIAKNQKPQTFDFEFVNISKDDVKIVKAGASWGCALPIWSDSIIVKPNQKSKITAVFNPKHEDSGSFYKKVWVKTNLSRQKVYVSIKGSVFEPKKTINTLSVSSSDAFTVNEIDSKKAIRLVANNKYNKKFFCFDLRNEKNFKQKHIINSVKVDYNNNELIKKLSPSAVYLFVYDELKQKDFAFNFKKNGFDFVYLTKLDNFTEQLLIETKNSNLTLEPSNFAKVNKRSKVVLKLTNNYPCEVELVQKIKNPWFIKNIEFPKTLEANQTVNISIHVNPEAKDIFYKLDFYYKHSNARFVKSVYVEF